MEEVKDLLKTYYFAEWKDSDDCVNTLLPKFLALIKKEHTALVERIKQLEGILCQRKEKK